jgi:hypothetical protein
VPNTVVHLFFPLLLLKNFAPGKKLGFLKENKFFCSFQGFGPFAYKKIM